MVVKKREFTAAQFFDGCHKYGWVITIVVNLLLFASFVGSMYQRLDDVRDRVGRLERQWDRYLNEVTKDSK